MVCVHIHKIVHHFQISSVLKPKPFRLSFPRFAPNWPACLEFGKVDKIVCINCNWRKLIGFDIKEHKWKPLCAKIDLLIDLRKGVTTFSLSLLTVIPHEFKSINANRKSIHAAQTYLRCSSSLALCSSSALKACRINKRRTLLKIHLTN